MAVLDKESLESDLDPSSSKVEFFLFYFGERVLTHARWLVFLIGFAWYMANLRQRETLELFRLDSLMNFIYSIQ